MGAIKYAPLSGTFKMQNYDMATNLVDYIMEGEIASGNEGNIILTSIGAEYQINQQFSIEYGYIGGHYLYNQNTLTLLTDVGVYAGSFISGASLFTPMSFTKHAFSVKYSF